jgi:hypothetical protein
MAANDTTSHKQPARRIVPLMKVPHTSLPKPVTNVAQITPTNLLGSVQATDKLRPNNLLNQARGGHSTRENYYADKLGWLHKRILFNRSGEHTWR